MENNTNSNLKNSLWNLVGGGAPIIIGFLSIPFAIKGLGKDGFGILTIAWIVLGYFGLFDLGFSQATTKFSSEHLANGDKKKFSSVFWVSFITSFGMGLIGTIVLTSLSPIIVNKLLKIPANLTDDAKLTFIILGLALPFIISSTSLKGLIAASHRFDVINKIQMPSNIMTYIIPCLSYFIGYKLSTVIILIVIMRIIIFLVYLYFCFSLYPFIKNDRRFDKVVFKSMISFGGWISTSNLLSPLLVYLDRFLIGSLVSISSVAFYTAPYELIIRTRLFPNSIMETLFPRFSAASANNDLVTKSKLFSDSLKYVTLIMGLVTVFFLNYSSYILNIWLGAEFSLTSTKLLEVLAVGVFFNGIATVPFFYLQATGKPDVPAKLHAIELLIFGVMFYFLIKYFGLIGAAITWSSRAFFDCIALFYITIKKEKTLLSREKLNEYTLLITIVVIFSVTAILAQLLNINIYFHILVGAVIFMCMTFTLWKFVLDQEEKSFIKDKLNLFLVKLKLSESR